MRAICVDDEPLLSERIAKLCRALKEIDEAYPLPVRKRRSSGWRTTKRIWRCWTSICRT